MQTHTPTPRGLTARWRIIACHLGLALATSSVATVARADGVMIPRPIPDRLPHPAPFSIKYHRVDVAIDGQTATTTIDQVFVNDNNADLEGTYIFPIPESASISDFSMWMNGEKVSAELLDANEARRIYEDIVRRMRDPGLLEYVGRDVFRARVYPIPRHGETRIELRYQELLPYDDGLVAYRYPLNTEKFSATNLQEVSVAVTIDADSPIKNVYSPSHDTDVRVDGRTARCGYEARDVKPDRDFLLYYSVSDRDLGLSLLTHRVPGEDGYFGLLLSPGELAPDAVIDKDIIFVLDTSGSMTGEKIAQARAAIEFCLRRLNPGDRFNILTFATSVRPFEDGLVRCTPENRDRALRFVAGIRARGGTAIHEALGQALDVAASENPRMIVFLTDGEPTVGETDIAAILDSARSWNETRVRVFPFGVGYDVNTHLLDQLSTDHRGTVSYVRPEEDIETKVASFYTRVSQPVLSDLDIDFGSVRVTDLYPVDLPDLFSGTQLVLFGRYRGEGSVAIDLEGTVRGRRQHFVFDARFPRQEAGQDFVPRLWASRKIGYLMSEIRLHGESQELVDEVVALSLEHGIITPYTSYLIVEDRPDLLSSVAVPRRAMERLKAGGGRGMVSESGSDAVHLSQDLSRSREETVAPRTMDEDVRHVGKKTFFGSEDGWTDSEADPAESEVTRIRFLSAEYFDLLRSEPGIGPYLALGPDVTFVFNDTTYRIID